VRNVSIDRENHCETTDATDCHGYGSYIKPLPSPRSSAFVRVVRGLQLQLQFLNPFARIVGRSLALIAVRRDPRLRSSAASAVCTLRDRGQPDHLPRMRHHAVTLAVLVAACSGGRSGGPLQPEPQPPVSAAEPATEARALWVSRFEFDSPQKIETIMQRAADANFNIVYFQVRGGADAIYRSTIEPCATVLCGRLGGTPSYDPLEVAVREAHERGLELHAWVNALTGFGAGSAAQCATLVESSSGNPRHALLEHPDWAMIDDTGARQACPNAEEYVWLSPGIPEVRTRLAKVAADITRRYAVDGIHLDRIRYPGTRWSYDPVSVAAFGQSPSANPTAWAQFRRDLVSLAVRETFDSVRAVRGDVALSVAAWGIYEDRWDWRSSRGFAQYFQDPHAWASGGYLDVAVPMTYYTITGQYCAFADWACLLDDHLAAYRAAGRHLHIGVPANKGLAEVIAQVNLGRTKGVQGFSVYSYSSAVAAGLFDQLPLTVFKRKATVPPITWR
jgi:uncharacterized lipoprotein YddW (UPF0748 family)